MTLSLKTSSRLSIWLKPRKGVRYLETSPRSQLWIMSGLCFLYFFQTFAFILLMENYPVAPLLTFKGFILAVYFLLFLGVGAFVVVQASSLAFWAAGKCFNGEGTLSQARAAVVWTLISSIPIGFFWLALYFAYSHQKLLGKAAGIIGVISCVGALMTMIYMLIVLIITLSEINKIGLWRALLATVMGVIISSAIYYALLPVFNLFSQG